MSPLGLGQFFGQPQAEPAPKIGESGLARHFAPGAGPPRLSARAANQPPPTNLIDEVSKAYPRIGRHLKGFAYRNSPDDGSGRGLEFYPQGERDSYDATRPALETFGDKAKAKDIAGDVASHYLAEGGDAKVTDYYKQFERSLTTKQQGILREQYEYAKANFGEKRSFRDWYKISGLPAYFRGYAFQQWDKAEEMYTPQQLKMFDEMNAYLKSPADEK